MLHQTLPLFFPFTPSSSSISPSSRSHPSPPPPPPATATLLTSTSSQVENETKMESLQPAALKNSFQPEFFTANLHGQHQSQPFSEEAWVVERGEDFSVDELLNLGGIVEEFEPHQRVEEEDEEEDIEDEEEESQQKPPPLPVQQKQQQDEEEETGSSGLSSAAEPLIPGGGISDLEWLSQFYDDSFSEFPCPAISPPYNPTPKPDTTGGHNPSSGRKRTWGSCFSLDNLVVPAKARSKRSRTGGRVWSMFRHHLVEPTTSSASSSSYSASSSACSSSSVLIAGRNPNVHLYFRTGKEAPFESLLLQKPKKKKGRKPKAAAPAGEDDGGSPGQRRCSHCGVQKTPQWRTGPLGAKTLCNACGVRFKSGRLLPEYRPASSPTFLSHVHSNCHRKVLEMRRKKEVVPATPSRFSPPPPLELGVLPLQHAIY